MRIDLVMFIIKFLPAGNMNLLNKIIPLKYHTRGNHYLNTKKLLLLLLIITCGFELHSQTYIISAYNGQTVNTCSGVFYDSGGSAGYYGINENYSVTFCSGTSDYLKFDFTGINIGTGDILNVYDGPDASSPLIASYQNVVIIAPFSLYSSGSCLTFSFVSDAGFTRPGWAANISCIGCPPAVTTPVIPSNIEVCAGSTINYSVTNHPGSTYNWTVTSGTPVSISGGNNSLDITWDPAGGVTGIVHIEEITSCGSIGTSELYVDIYSLPDVDFSGLNTDYCIDAAPVTLSGNPAGGIFSGPGINTDIFTPSIAGAGIHNISYSITDYTNVSTGCSNQAVYTTNVHEKPAVSFIGLNIQYDISDPASILIGNPTGGVFSGPGISGITFTPSIAGIGIHNITYTYSDIYCSNTATTETNVTDYDLKSGAKLLTSTSGWCSANAQFSTVGATGDELKGSCWTNGPNYNRWFKFQATTSDITIQLKTGGAEGTLQYPYLALWDASNTQLGCATYSSQYSDIEIVRSGLTIGDWYYISVDNYSGTGYRGTFSICVDATVNYDLKAGAITIPDINNWCSAEAAYTTLGATGDELKGSCWNNGPNFNRWFKFQAATSGLATIQLKTGGAEGTLQYPFMALWDASNIQLGCAIYSSQYSDLEIVTEGLTPGEWYYVSVDNNNNTGQRGTFTLCVDESINYDLKAGAIPIPSINSWCSADAAYTTIGATADELKGSCWNNGPNFNRWFKFQATASGVATIQLKTGAGEGTLQYPFLALWDAANSQIGCATYYSQYSDIEVVAQGLTPGDWYYISVDNYTGTGYRGTFTLCVDETINYDLKAGAVEIPGISNWCSSDAAYTTVGATADELKGSCWNSGPNFNRWFKFQATATGNATIQLKTGGAEGTLQYPFLALWDASNTQLGCAIYSSQYSDLEIVTEGLTPGEWYYVSVDNNNNTGYRGTFTLCVDESINYDLKAGAIAIPSINNWCSTDAAYTTIGATADELKGSCWNNGPNYNRWFKFQATASGVATIQLKTGGAEGTLQNPFLALWDASNTQLGCARYSSTYSDIEIVAQGLTPGDWYYISVDNYTGTGYRGTFTLCVDETINYDLKAGAVEIPGISNWCSSDAAYTTVGATADELKGSCWNSGPNFNRWFKFQATATGNATIQLKTGGAEGTLQYPFLALWDASNTQLGCAIYSSQYSDLEIVTEGLTPGEWYYVSVDNNNNTGYRGTFTLCVDESINYDLKAGAIAIPSINNWCSTDAAYTTIGATADELKGSCWNNGPNYNRWFKFQATASGVATIQLKTGGAEGTLQNPFLALWDASNTQLGCARYSSTYSDIEIVAQGLTPGDWYFISVDNYTGTGYRGTFTLCVDETINYDLKAGAVEIPGISNWCSSDAAYTTVGATADELKGSCWNSGPNFNRWFKFQATATGNATIQLKTGGAEGTLQYPFLALWDASNTQLGCATYSSQYSDLEIVTEGLTPGEWYYVSVDNNNNTGYRGTFTLCVDESINYDLKAGAIAIPSINNWCSTDAAYTTIGATADELKGSCWNNGPNYNRWFKFQATASGVATIQLKTGGAEGTLQNPFLALWDASNTQLGCARYSSTYSDIEIVAQGLTPGDWYYISVDNYTGTGYRGTFTLCVDETINYDLKAGAVEIPGISNWCSSDAAYTTVGATADELQGSCWSNGPNYNRWFKFQATATGNATIQLKTGGDEGTLQYPFLALWDAANNQVGCTRYSSQYSDIEIVAEGLTPGEWYYISVDNYVGTGYRGTFTLCVDASINYDLKAGAVEIPAISNWCSPAAAYSTIGATPDELKGSCWNNGPNYNRWFKFQATATGICSIQLKTGGIDGTIQSPFMALWDASNTELGCARYTSQFSNLEIVASGLIPGDWYYISVDNYVGTGNRGTFSLCIDDKLSYNFKDGAIELSDLNGWCSTNAEFSTVGATADEAKGLCWPNGPNYNRWFTFQATGSSIIVDVRTTNEEGTLRRPFIALWDASLAEVGCSIYVTDNSDVELSSTTLVTGNWYYISVDNSVGTGYQGSFTLCASKSVPNDNYVNAIILSDFNSWCSADSKFTNIIATPDGTIGSCFAGGINKRNVWFRFQALNSSVTTTVTTGGNYGTMSNQQIAIFDATNTQVGCTGPLSGQGALSLTVNNLTAGEWYWISVDDDNISGTFTLCIDDNNVYTYPSGAYELTDLHNWCSSSQAFTNLGSLSDTKSGSCWTAGTYNNKWFKFQATTDQIKIQVKTGAGYGTMVRQQLALWDASGTEIGCAKWVSNTGTVILQSDALTPGDWYWISVDDASTSGTFTLCINEQVDYDFRSGAITVPTNWCSSDAAYDNTFATDDGIMGTCWSGSVNKNVWFRFTALTTFMKISVITGGGQGTMVHQQVALWNNAGTQIGCARWVTGQGTITLQTLGLTAGQDYWISVDDDNTSGTFSLCLDDQVDYDYKAGAVTLSTNWCSSNAAYNNIFATEDESMGSCWSGTVNKNVWFKFTALTSFMKVSVTTGAGYGTMVHQQFALWDAAGTQVGCAKWVTGQGTVTLQTNSLTIGQDYWISVDDDNTSGSFSLCLDDQVDYDYKAGAITVPTNWCSSEAEYNNIFATEDESMGSCWSGTTNKNVWFKFTALTSFMKISVTTGAGFGTMVHQQFALWDAAGTQIGCAKWVTTQGTVTLQTIGLTIGQDYWISVDDDYTSGTFSLCLDDQVNYDYKSGAVNVATNWCSSDAEFDNIFATDDENMGSCWTGTVNKNVWFKFTALTPFIKVSVITGGGQGTMVHQQFALWDAAGAQVGCAKWVTGQGTVTLQTNSLTIGQDYWISVDDDNTSGSFSLCLDDQVDYDYKAGAITVPTNWCSSEAEYNNIFATEDESMGSCWSGTTNKNVWFKFTALTSFMKISVTTGAGFGTMVHQQFALWDAAGTQVGCARWINYQGTVTLQAIGLTIGQDYWISVDDDYTSGTFTICLDDQVNYDYKSGAVNVATNWCSSDAEFDNIFATDDESMGSCWSGTVNKNVWFKFTALTPFMKVSVTTGAGYGTMVHQQFALWDAAGTQVGCAKWINYQGTVTLQTNALTIGQDYWISVDDDNTSGTFSLCLNDQVDYDYKAGAITVPTYWCSSDAAYDNIFATEDESMGTCWSGTVNKNVWFKFTALTSFMKISVTTGAGFGTMVHQQFALWDAVGTQVGCARWINYQGTVTLQSNALTIGQDYWISVDDDNTSGTFSLCLNDQVDYDYKSGAITVPTNWCSSDAAYDNIFATEDESMGTCWSGTVNKNVWFKFTALTSFIKVSVTTGAGYGTMVHQQFALWDAAGTQVGCARWINYQGTVALQTNTLTIGQDYWISVDDDNTSGTFSLCLNDQVDYDYKSGAITVPTNWCSSDAAYDNIFATADESMGSCWTGLINKNVWFRFTALTTFMKVSVITGGGYGTMVHQQVALWNAAGTQVACGRWVNGQNIVILQTNGLAIGDDYWISVDDDNVSGTFSLCLTDQIDYDYKAGAFFISNTNNWCSSDAQYDNTYATADGSMGSCWGGLINKNVWFRFNATTNFAKINVNTGTGYGTMARQQFAIWDAAGTQIGCAKYTVIQGVLSLQVNTLTPGQDYWISVDDDLTSGTFSLCVNTAPLGVNVTSTNVTCFGLNNGTAIATPSGGVAPYTYLWTGPGSFISTGSSITNLVPGTYNVKVTGQNGDFVNGSAIVTQPAAALNGSILSQSNVSCSGGNDGTVTVTGSGGTPGYQYNIDGGTYQLSGMFGSLSAGNHSVMVQDIMNCTFLIPVTITTLLDVIPPVISGCPSDITQSNDAGLCSAVVTWTEPSATDNCTAAGALVWNRSHAPGSVFPVGITTVTYTATDAALNISNVCSFTVTVNDTEKPVISGCPSDITQSNDAGLCSAVVTWSEPSATDNCTAPGALVWNRSHAPGSVFPVGITTVTYTATDAALNISNVCSFTVTVNDTEKPVISGCPSDITQSNDAGLCSAVVTWTEPSATDNCTAAGALVWNRSHAPGSVFPVGITTVTYTATDAALNISNVCSFTVTVNDTEKPVISGCPSDITQSNDAGLCSAVVTWTEPSATDNCTATGALVWNRSHAPGSVFPVGITTVTYTATDAALNISNVCSFTVTVNDTEKPVISGCPSDITQSNDAGLCSAVVTWSEPSATDNCTAPGALVWNRSHAPGSVFPVGITTVTYTATDVALNISDGCSFTVTVNDTEKPVISGCPSDITQSNDAGLCSAVVTWTEPSATDNCTAPGALVWNRSHAPGSVFPVGITTVTYTATDAALNISNVCSFTVTVNDTEKPVISGCPSDITQSNDAGLCSAVVTWTEPSATDNCTATGALVWNRSHAPGSVFPVGITTVTYTATDAALNISNVCSFTVTVNDTEKPVISGCPSDITQSNDAGLCSAVVTWTEPSATDNCTATGALVWNRSHAPGSVFPVGITTVTYTATDAALNISNVCSFTVTVNDTEKPVISGCPSDITQSNDAGLCSAVVTWTEPSATDNCTAPGALVWNRSHAPGSVFPVGITTVTYTATDAALNISNVCSFTVTVNDTEKPVISGCPSDITQSNDAGLCSAVVTWTEPSATDNCTAPGALVWNRSHAPGSVFPVGITTVTYTATDAALNISDGCSFTVTVNDTEKPVISGCPSDITQSNDAGLCSAVVTWSEPSATDNCTATGALVWNRSHAPGSVFPVGITTVTYTATDAALNISNVCSFTVTVNDTEKPVISGCPSDITQSNDAGLCSAVVTWTEPSATDNCTAAGALVWNRSHAPGSVFPVGITTVTYTATDAALNISNVCSFTVTVNDTEKPVISGCPSDITQSNDAGLCSAVVTWSEPSATDNCTAPGALVWNRSHAPGSVFPVGITTVTYTATDVALNISDGCSFTVTVNDTEKPVISGCPSDITQSNDAGLCSAVVTWTEPSATDNCTAAGALVWNRSHAPGSVFPVGITTVTYTATDAALNISNVCSFTVTVNDTEKPVISGCPSDITQSNDAGLCSAVVTWTEPSATDNCTATGALVWNRSHAPGSVFPVGITTVTYTATDAALNISNVCSFTVTVNDTEKPVISGCPSDITQSNDAGLCSAVVTWSEPSATDNCTAPGALVWNRSHAPGSVFPVGITTVTYTATDVALNISDGCSFTVTVNDTEKPVISGCPSDITQSNDAGLCSAVVTWTEPSATDNCTAPGALVWNRSHAPGSVFPVGITTVTYTATDAALNISNVCSFTVTVNDTEKPVISGCPSDITQSNDAGLCSAVVTWTEPSATDNCTATGALVWNRSHAPGSVFPVGITTVTYTATDAALNISNVCSFTVTVNDTEKPVISGCPSDITQSNDAGLCSAVVTWTEPSATDNCTATGALVWNRSHAPGSVFPVGITTVTYTATDAALNISNVCSFTVTVNDTEKPVISGCPSDITQSNDAGLCSAVVTWSEPSATDNCTATGALVWNRSHAPGSVFPVGITTVTYTATDAALNISNVCSFTVTVNDTEKPVISGCPSDITQSNDAGLCSAVVTWSEPSATDNCTATGALVWNRSHAPGSVFPVGITTVTYTATDAALNISNVCSFTVTVNDTEKPVISGCPSDITQSNDAGLCSAVVTWSEPSATDNCTATGALVWNRSHAPGSVFPVGITTVTYTATDAALNISDVCSFTVTVNDTEKPVISGCPSDITQSNDAGLCSAVVTWTEPSATDNCTAPGALVWNRSHAPGSVFPVGITTVTYTATDAALNISNVCSFTVTVNDTEKPVISGCPSDITQSNDAGLCSAVVTWTEPSATDNCTATGALVWNRSHAPGSVFPVGITTVTYTATDAALNISDGCSFTVTVNDTEKPVISGCPSDITQSNDAGLCSAVVTWTEPSATDNCTAPGALVWNRSHAPGSVFPVGITTVTYTATDAALNISNVCSFTVTVNDTEKPVISGCPSDITQSNDAGLCSAVVTWTEPSATDNCTAPGALVWNRSHAPGSVFPVGITTVTYTATDAALNISDGCSFTVTVNDTEKPVISGCPSDITQSNDAGLCSAVVTWTEPSATDNCTAPGALVWNRSHAPGSVFPVGITTVTYTATDAALNISNVCSFTVTVNDTEKPVISGCPSDITQSNDAGLCSAVVTWSEPSATDNCTAPGALVWNRSHAPGSVFPVGITTVTYTATDAALNISDVCSFTVTVNDTEKPVISGCPSDITQSNDAGLCSAVVTWSEPSATDNCTAPGALVWNRSHAPGSVFPVGITTVTYTATDAALNISDVCSFTVTVNDTEKPVISCPADIIQNADIGLTTTSVIVPDASISDNCSVYTLTWIMTGATTGTSQVSGINQVGTHTFSTGLTTVQYTISDLAGNSSTCTFTVTITPSLPPLTVTVISHSDVACYGASTGTITVDGSGGLSPYEYKLDGGSYQTSGIFETLAAGTYTVTIKDALLYTSDVIVTIKQPLAAIQGSISSQTNVLCNGSNTGSISIFASGGTPAYLYKLGTGAYQSSGIFETLSSGSYIVTIQDANLCTFEVPFTISQPAKELTGSITTQANVSCSGFANGSVTVSGVGGTEPFEYSIDGGTYQTSGIFTGLTSGTYSVTVRDANLCNTVVPITITEPEVLKIEPSVIDASCPDEPDGSINLTITGGTQPYTVIWSYGISTQNRTNLLPGDYSLVLSDLNGCALSMDITVGFSGTNKCLVIPQVITPNNDGFNDTWVIKNIDFFPNAEISVFTRWGKLVYRTRNISANPWDGTFQGAPLPTDSYHYMLDLNDGSLPRSGVISIIR